MNRSIFTLVSIAALPNLSTPIHSQAVAPQFMAVSQLNLKLLCRLESDHVKQRFENSNDAVPKQRSSLFHLRSTASYQNF